MIDDSNYDFLFINLFYKPFILVWIQRIINKIEMIFRDFGVLPDFFQDEEF